MTTRLQHSLRFAITTLVAVYSMGLVYELVETFVLHHLASVQAEELVTFNERIWRSIAIAEAVAVFLLRLADVHTAPPSWGFAWGSAAWLGVTSVATLIALEEEYWRTAVAIVLLAGGLWFVLHHRFRGWPGARPGAVDHRPRELH